MAAATSTSSCPGILDNILVGGFNPVEKYARQNRIISPNFQGENKEYLKPPPSNRVVVDSLYIRLFACPAKATTRASISCWTG